MDRIVRGDRKRISCHSNVRRKECGISRKGRTPLIEMHPPERNASPSSQRRRNACQFSSLPLNLDKTGPIIGRLGCLNLFEHFGHATSLTARARAALPERSVPKAVGRRALFHFLLRVEIDSREGKRNREKFRRLRPCSSRAVARATSRSAVRRGAHTARTSR